MTVGNAKALASYRPLGQMLQQIVPLWYRYTAPHIAGVHGQAAPRPPVVPKGYRKHKAIESVEFI